MTEEDYRVRLINETEPFEQLWTLKDDEEGAPNRWMQLRTYEMHEYADLWVYRYKMK